VLVVNASTAEASEVLSTPAIHRRPTLIAHVGVGGHRGRRDGALDVREEPGEQIVDVHEPEERAAVSVDQRRTVCARFR
jgi:hypothetical protein